jgi:hypothetical protein
LGAFERSWIRLEQNGVPYFVCDEKRHQADVRTDIYECSAVQISANKRQM